MESLAESEKKETFWFFWLRFLRAYDSAYDSDSDSVASENQPPVKEYWLFGSSSRSTRASGCTFTCKPSRISESPFFSSLLCADELYQFLDSRAPLSWLVLQQLFPLRLLLNNYFIPEHSIVFGFPLPYISLNALTREIWNMIWIGPDTQVKS